MGVETAIYSRLTSHSGTKAIVSTRVYPVVLPQECAYPAIAYQSTSMSYEPTFMGNDGALRTEMQIDCYAEEYADVKSLADQVRDALMDWSAASPVIWRCFHAGEGDGPIEPDTGLYRVSMDFEIFSPA